MWRRRLFEDPGQGAITPGRVCAQELWQMADGFLASVRFEKAEARAKKEPGQLGPAAVKVLAMCGLEVGKALMDVYSGLSLHPGEGKAALDELLARGLVRLHPLPRKGRGARPMAVEVTDPGKQELARRGIVVPEPVLKGGFKHDLYGRELGQRATRHGHRYSYERTLGRKTFDMVCEKADGSLMAIEVCLTGTARVNAEQAMKGLENEGISELVLACETKKFAEEIMKESSQIDRLGLYRARVRVCQLAEFLED